MCSDFELTVTPDRTQACLTLNSRQPSLADIRAEIKNRKIIAGLRWKRLQAGIAECRQSDQDSFSIIVAQTRKPAHSLLLGSRKIELSPVGKRRLINDLRNLYRMLSRAQPDVALPECVFAKKNGIFCKERFCAEYTDIYNAVTTMTFTGKPSFQYTDSVTVEKNGNWFDYRAVCNGYVTANSSGELHIFPVHVASPDRMKMYFMLVSSATDRSDMLACLYASKQAADGCAHVSLPEKHDLPALFDAGGITKILIATGTPPRPGRDAQLLLKVNARNQPADNAVSMDMKAFSSLCEVAADTLIAEKLPAVTGVAGVDVYGKGVPVEPVKDIAFRAGNNVREERRDDIIRFVAAVDGILRLTDYGADISDHLVISHDVGPLTGHVKFGGNIIIAGDVIGGYQVICGQNLTIEGSVNDGARITCKGNLIVARGVHGQGTKLEVKGNADIGFIQQSQVSVRRNLEVQRSIRHSHVFCGGVLEVRGKGIDAGQKGCVAGGETVAMRAMRLQSAGSPINRTRLFCGVNPDGVKALRFITTRMGALNRRVVRLRQKIGIDLNRPDALNVINSLGTVQKEGVRAGLLEIREMAAEQENLQVKLTALQVKAWAPDLHQCIVDIKKGLFPDVQIQIGRALLTVYTKTAGVQFSLEGEDIVVQPAA